MIAWDVPVTPDADTAREWAVDELSKDEYREQAPSWFERALRAIQEFFDNLGNSLGNFHGGTAVLALLVAAIVITLLVLVVVRPMRAERGKRRKHSVFEDDERDAAAMHREAMRGAATQDWTLAVIEMYRAIVRSLEERDLIEDRPGVTAHEAAVETARRFPDIAAPMEAGADFFDGARYGHFVALETHYLHLVDLHRALANRSLMNSAAP